MYTTDNGQERTRFTPLTEHKLQVGEVILRQVNVDPSAERIGAVAIDEVEKLLSEHLCRSGHRFHLAGKADPPWLYCRRCGVTKPLTDRRTQRRLANGYGPGE
jgi:hypothetical protein